MSRQLQGFRRKDTEHSPFNIAEATQRELRTVFPARPLNIGGNQMHVAKGAGGFPTHTRFSKLELQTEVGGRGRGERVWRRRFANRKKSIGREISLRGEGGEIIS